MVAPIITFTESDDATAIDDTTNPDAIGQVVAGSQSSEKEIHIWNNQGGVSDVSEAENVMITTVTKTGLESGDTEANGKEVVEYKMYTVKSITNEETEFTAVGGATTHLLGGIRGNKLTAPTGLNMSVVAVEGGEVVPGTYYGKVSALDETGETLPSSEDSIVAFPTIYEETTSSATGEVLSTVGNTKMAFKITPDVAGINGLMLLMDTGGSLVGSVRIETDNTGSPSGTLVHANGEKTGITLLENQDTNIWFDNEVPVTIGVDYWVVFTATNGTGSLKGNGTGASVITQYFDGSWHDSSTLYTAYGYVTYYNAINYDWTDNAEATEFKVFRSSTSESYGATSLVAEEVTDSEYDNIEAETVTGTPVSPATVTYEHNHAIKRVLDVPSYVTAGQIDCFVELRYVYI